MATSPAVTVQLLPPGPVDESLHYDRHLYDGRRSNAVSIRSELAYSDFNDHMHIERRVQQRRKRWLPAWAFDDAQFRQVILTRCWLYCHGGSPMPKDTTWRMMRAMCDAFGERYTQLGAAKRETGYLEFLVKLLWLSARLGHNATEVAAQLGITSVHVRQELYKTNRVAELLRFPVHKVPHTSKGVWKKTRLNTGSARLFRRRQIESGVGRGVIFNRIQRRKARRSA
jgi:hypothetical protein